MNPPAPKSDKELERDELLTQADRIETGLGVASQPHVISSTGFDSVAAVFEEELSRLSDRIINRYESGLTESTFSYSLPLPAELLPGINDANGETRLNLHELGFLAPNDGIRLQIMVRPGGQHAWHDRR